MPQSLAQLMFWSILMAHAHVAVAIQRTGDVTWSVALPEGSPMGEASIREHAVAWHSGKEVYYLVADVVPLASSHHPNTYETELHLWRSPNLADWTYIGLAVPRGQPGHCYDGYGVASPSGMVCRGGRIYVPFSARKTAAYTKRGIGIAWSGTDPDGIPWTKTEVPVSDLPGEDDDPALVMIPGDPRVHLYHRTTGGGYHIVHTASATPEAPASWPTAKPVTSRPEGVRSQELTGVIWTVHQTGKRYGLQGHPACLSREGRSRTSEQ